MGLIFRDNPSQEPLPRVWGPGLFDNYAGVNARNFYLEYLLDGRDDESASRLTVEARDIDARDMQTDVLFWTALASVQMDVGRLDGSVKEAALYYIDRGDNAVVADNEQWRDQRQQVLDSLVRRLEASQRPPMNKENLRRYCYALWGDDWSLHADSAPP